MIESPLRDLARQLRHTARHHVAYSQVADFMSHVESYLSALAYHEETVGMLTLSLSDAERALKNQREKK